MTDDYCATLCLHWAQSGAFPATDGTQVWSATQFSYTCWCGTAEDSDGWSDASQVDLLYCK